MDDIIGNSQYFEVSAKKPDQVEKMFKQLLTNIINSEKLRDKILMENQPQKIKLTKKNFSRKVERGSFSAERDPEFRDENCQC